MVTKAQAFIAALSQLFLAAMAGVSLVSAVYLTLKDKPANASIAGVLGLLLIAFVRISAFKKFKGLGFEAELWEDKQKEAEALIDQTRALIVLLSTTFSNAAPRIGRMMPGFTRRELLDFLEQLEQAMAAAGISKKEQVKVWEETDRLLAFDLASTVVNRFNRAVEGRANDRQAEVTQQFGSPITDMAGFNKAVAECHEIRAGAIRFGVGDTAQEALSDLRSKLSGALPGFSAEERRALHDELREGMLDLEAWLTGRQVRRPDVFHARD